MSDEEVIAPGAFDGQIGKVIPLTYGIGGPVIGEAWVIGDGIVEMVIEEVTG